MAFWRMARTTLRETAASLFPESEEGRILILGVLATGHLLMRFGISDWPALFSSAGLWIGLMFRFSRAR